MEFLNCYAEYCKEILNFEIILQKNGNMKGTKKMCKIFLKCHTEIQNTKTSLTTDQMKFKRDNQKISQKKKLSRLKLKNISTLQKALTCHQN